MTTTLAEVMAEARAQQDALERVRWIATLKGGQGTLDDEEAQLILDAIEEAREMATGYATLVGDLQGVLRDVVETLSIEHPDGHCTPETECMDAHVERMLAAVDGAAA